MKKITVFSEKSKKPLFTLKPCMVKSYPRGINANVIIDSDIVKVDYDVKTVLNRKYIVLTIYFGVDELFKTIDTGYIKITDHYSTEMFNIYLKLLRIVEENKNDRLLQN